MNAPIEPAAHEAPVEETTLSIAARDGFALGARLFRREGQSDAPDAVVFASGGGLSVVRYRHFLRHLAAAGIPVLAYDYRGVGLSRPARLRGFAAGLEDWAELDQAGAVDALRERFPAARLTTIAHSIGSLVAATAPNAGSLSQMVFIGPHTGYWRDYARGWRIPMALTWHVVMPALTHAVGFFPGHALRLGDDLPRGFALQWAGRTAPSFALGGDDAARSRGARLLASAEALAVPALVISFADDAFASERGVRRFLHAIPSVPVVRRHLEPGPAGRFGHFGFFSRRHRAQWPLVSRFLAPVRMPGTSGA
jgi:predicted alpha/beta hydrolase